jgi:hypothetical protein
MREWKFIHSKPLWLFLVMWGILGVSLVFHSCGSGEIFNPKNNPEFLDSLSVLSNQRLIDKRVTDSIVLGPDYVDSSAASSSQNQSSGAGSSSDNSSSQQDPSSSSIVQSSSSQVSSSQIVSSQGSSSSDLSSSLSNSSSSLASSSSQIPQQYAVLINQDTIGWYEVGQEVTISAQDSLMNEKCFQQWSGPVVFTPSPDSIEVSFAMPSFDLPISMQYQTCQYRLDATIAGSPEVRVLPKGEIVNLVAPLQYNEQCFSHWSGAEDVVSNVNALQIQFAMPNKSLSISAEYVDCPSSSSQSSSAGDLSSSSQEEVSSSSETTSFLVSLQNGTLSTQDARNGQIEAYFTAGEIVDIVANDSSAQNKSFSEWQRIQPTGLSLSNALNATTSFVMPSEAVVLRAVYTTASTPTNYYKLTVINGNWAKIPNASQEYYQGDPPEGSILEGGGAANPRALLQAQAQYNGQCFSHWEGSANIHTASSANTALLVMPGNDLTITAVYQDCE